LFQVVGAAIVELAQKWTIRTATAADLDGAAEVFFAAFPESVRHYTGCSAEEAAQPELPRWHGPRRLMAALFGVCLHAEAGCMFVAEDPSQPGLAGYIITPARLSGIVRQFLHPRQFLRISLPLLADRYQLPPHAIGVSLRNTWHSWRELRRDKPELACEARILSVAVHPRSHGQGLGQALCRAGLAYLRGQGATCVRLEVRPQNAPAHHLYTKLGFTLRGQTSDSQGLWDIMLLKSVAAPAD
jgi:ribosomal protein S18 acetylase RimI-like enzyme